MHSIAIYEIQSVVDGLLSLCCHLGKYHCTDSRPPIANNFFIIWGIADQ